MMDFRRVFDSVPEEFDKWRFRYCDELFADVIEYANLNAGKSALEIGPGTGQATEPILKTGCSYLAIELGENLAKFTQNKFGGYRNFQIVNADFETYDFGPRKFDLVYSAATIQWIPEAIAFPKSFDLLKSGGTLAMMMTHSDYKTPNEELYNEIQAVYGQYFHPEIPYTCHLEYKNAVRYGFSGFERREYPQTAVFSAEDYVSLISIHADHLTLKEPDKSNFLGGVRNAILRHGDRITLNQTIILYLARKP